MERRSLTYLKWGIVFYFLNVYVDRLNLLPEFAGLLLLYASIQSHGQQTETERRLKPLLLLLAADRFLHWIWQFENNLEGLIVLVIFLYTFFVLTGEVAERIREEQPERARQLETVRVCIVLLQCASFLILPYGIERLNLLLSLSAVGVCAGYTVIACRIQPVEE